MFDVHWQGTAPFPATIVYADVDGVDFSLNAGTSPSSGTFNARSDFAGAFPGEGNLVMNDGSTTITLKVRATEGRAERSLTARTVPVTFVDRRWKWKYGYVNGTYNQPDGNGRTPEDAAYTGNKKTAQDLVAECLNAMPGEAVGTTAFIDNVPTDEYPMVRWGYANAAKSLQEVLDEVGCLVTLCSDDKARCYALDGAASLPSGDYDHYQSGDKLAERPEKILIVGSRIILEEEFENFEAVGLDTDGDVKLLSELSYKPVDGAGAYDASGWDHMFPFFLDLQTEKDKMEAAKESIFKWFRVVFDAGDDIENAALADQKLPFLSYRSEIVKNRKADPSGSADENVHAVPQLKGEKSLHTGVWWKTYSVDDPIQEGWSLDAKNGIVKFSTPQFKPVNSADSELSGGYSIPSMKLRAAYKRNEGDEDDVYVYECTTDWGPIVSDSGTVHVVHVPELVLYKIDGVSQNEADLKAWSEKRAAQEQKKFEVDHDPAGKTYVGLKSVSPNSGIRSVRWSINGSGATTEAQLGFEEPAIDKMTYNEKLRETTSWREIEKAKEERRKTEREAKDAR